VYALRHSARVDERQQWIVRKTRDIRDHTSDLFIYLFISSGFIIVHRRIHMSAAKRAKFDGKRAPSGTPTRVRCCPRRVSPHVRDVTLNGFDAAVGAQRR